MLEGCWPRNLVIYITVNAFSISNSPYDSFFCQFFPTNQFSPNPWRSIPNFTVYEISILKIPYFKNLCHNWIRILNESPCMFSQHGLIEGLKIPKAHTTHTLRQTHRLSFLPINFLFIETATLPKDRQKPIKIMRNSFRKSK